MRPLYRARCHGHGISAIAEGQKKYSPGTQAALLAI